METNRDIVSAAIRNLRIGAFLSETPNTDIAKAVGLSRQTIGKKLKSKDMSLLEFVDIASATGQDPAQLLEKAQKMPSGDAEGKGLKGKTI